MENTNYKSMFSSYPDVVNFTQMKEMLGNIGSTLAYKLLRENTIFYNINSRLNLNCCNRKD